MFTLALGVVPFTAVFYCLLESVGNQLFQRAFDARLWVGMQEGFDMSWSRRRLGSGLRCSLGSSSAVMTL